VTLLVWLSSCDSKNTGWQQGTMTSFTSPGHASDISLTQLIMRYFSALTGVGVVRLIHGTGSVGDVIAVES
jgi:hypothetical protein